MSCDLQPFLETVCHTPIKGRELHGFEGHVDVSEKLEILWRTFKRKPRQNEIDKIRRICRSHYHYMTVGFRMNRRRTCLDPFSTHNKKPKTHLMEISRGDAIRFSFVTGLEEKIIPGVCVCPRCHQQLLAALNDYLQMRSMKPLMKTSLQFMEENNGNVPLVKELLDGHKDPSLQQPILSDASKELGDKGSSTLCHNDLEDKNMRHVADGEQFINPYFWTNPLNHHLHEVGTDNIISTVQQCFKEKKYCDVVLYATKSSEGEHFDQFEPFKAHSLILSSISPFFKNILQKSWSAESDTCIILDDISSDDLKGFLDAIYGCSPARGRTTKFHEIIEMFNASPLGGAFTYPEDELETTNAEVTSKRLLQEDTNTNKKKSKDVMDNQVATNSSISIEDQMLTGSPNVSTNSVLTKKNCIRPGQGECVEPRPTEGTQEHPRNDRGNFGTQGTLESSSVQETISTDESSLPSRRSLRISQSTLNVLNGEEVGSECDGISDDIDIEMELEVEDSGRASKIKKKDKDFDYEPSEEELESEMSGDESNESDFFCEECKVTIKESIDLRDHMENIHSKKNLWYCTDCPTFRSSKGYLSVHYNRAHLKIKPMKCSECEKSFYGSETLNSHLKVKHGKLIERTNPSRCCGNIHSPKCCKCEKEFSVLSKLNKHVKEQHEGSRICHICGKTFAKQKHLSQHIKVLHESHSCLCQDCGTTFTNQNTMDAHRRRVHNSQFKVSCSICKTVLARTSLRNHMESVHEHLRPFACEFCERKFYLKNELDNHIARMHTKIRNFQCDYCEKDYVTKGECKQHIESVHMKVRRHSCLECDKQFYKKQSLDQHIARVHTRIKTFKCKFCEMAFTVLFDRQRHVKNVHNEFYKTR